MVDDDKRGRGMLFARCSTTPEERRDESRADYGSVIGILSFMDDGRDGGRTGALEA
jgi:hypothetical protein